MKKKIENKRQKFVRLAELRTEKAVLAIENLIGLSNPRNYDYNAKDVNLIIKALTDSVNAVSSSFSKSKEKKQFKIANFEYEILFLQPKIVFGENAYIQQEQLAL